MNHDNNNNEKYQQSLSSQDQQQLGALVVMAAVKDLYPEAILVRGSAENEQFYYEFGFKNPINSHDLQQIHQKVQNILKDHFIVKQYRVRREEAYMLFHNEPEKILELAEQDSPAPMICQIDDWFDLCENPLIVGESSLDDISISFKELPAQISGDFPWIRQRIYGMAQ